MIQTKARQSHFSKDAVNIRLTSGLCGAVESGDQAFHVVGKSAFKPEIFAAHGVAERQGPGVQSLAGKTGNSILCLRRQGGAPPTTGAAVDRVADDRVTDMRQVDADLVCAPGLKATFHQACGAIEIAQYPVMGNRHLAALGHHRHLLAVLGVAPDIAFNAVRDRTGKPPYERLVYARQTPRGELGGETLVGRVRFGGDHEAAGILIEPVDNAGAHDPANARQAVAAMGNEGVDQGRVRITRGRMYDHARRLIDNNQRGVFIDHVEGDGLASGYGRRCLGDSQIEGLVWFDPIRGVGYGRAARNYLAILDQRLDPGARQIG